VSVVVNAHDDVVVVCRLCVVLLVTV